MRFILIFIFILTSKISAQTQTEYIDIMGYEFYNNLLILSDNNDPVYKFIDLDTKNIIFDFGRKGRGPGEIQYPRSFKIKENKNSSTINIYYIEFSTNILKSFTVDVDERKVFLNDDIQLNREFTGLFNPTLVNDSTLIGTYDDYFDDKRHKKTSLVINNLKSNEYKEIMLYHLKSEPYEYSTQLNINARYITYDSEVDIVYSLAMNSNFVEIINLKDSSLETVILDNDEADLTSTNPDVFNSETYRPKYMNIGLYKDYIFILKSIYENKNYNNVLTLYDKNFNIINKRRFISDTYMSIAKANEYNNSIIMFSYDNNSFYEMKIINSVISEAKPFYLDK